MSEKNIGEREILLRLNDIAGLPFGTEDFSVFLYSLVSMHAPATIVELGTGIGTSAFWMAAAAKKNGVGHVWTVDDFEWFNHDKERVRRIITNLRDANVISFGDVTPEEFYSQMSNLLGLDDYLTFVKAKIMLKEVDHFNLYSFSKSPIDLLFSDFRHGSMEILELLGHFLPKMAPSSSIFIHSASTSWASYLLLEQIVSHLNAGNVPKALQELCSTDVNEAMKNRRIQLVHLTERKADNQNSAAWLKIEPIDVFPHPRTKMRP